MRQAMPLPEMTVTPDEEELPIDDVSPTMQPAGVEAPPPPNTPEFWAWARKKFGNPNDIKDAVGATQPGVPGTQPTPTPTPQIKPKGPSIVAPPGPGGGSAPVPTPEPSPVGPTPPMGPTEAAPTGAAGLPEASPQMQPQINNDPDGPPDLELRGESFGPEFNALAAEHALTWSDMGNTTSAMAVSMLDKIQTGAMDPDTRRFALTFGLGTAGGIAGSFANPAIGVLGGTAGEMMGGYIANAIDSVLHVQAKPEEKKGMLQQILSEPAVSNTLGGLVIPMAWNSRLGWRPAAARIFGLGPQTKELMEAAADIGKGKIRLGLVDVVGPDSATGTALSAMTRLPFLGSGSRHAAHTKATALMESYNDLFGQLASKSTAGEVADEVVTRLQQNFTNRATKIVQDQVAANGMSSRVGNVIDTGVLKTEAQKILNSANIGILSHLPPEAKRVTENFLKNGPDAVSPQFIHDMETKLEEIARRHSKTQYPLLDQLRHEFESSYVASRHLSRDAAAHKEAQRAVKAMNKVQEDYRDLVSTTQQSLVNVGRIERAAVGGYQTKAGTDTIQKLEGRIASMNTPNQARQMRAAIGDENMEKLGAMRLDKAWEDATKEFRKVQNKAQSRFEWDGDKFRKALGLDDPSGNKYKVTEELLKGSSMTMDKLKSLDKVAQAVSESSEVIMNAGQFFGRSFALRALSGGTSTARMLKNAYAITAAAAGGAAMGSSGGSLAAGILMSQLANKGLASLVRPGMLEAYTQALAPGRGHQMAVQTLHRWFELYPEDWD